MGSGASSRASTASYSSNADRVASIATQTIWCVPSGPAPAHTSPTPRRDIRRDRRPTVPEPCPSCSGLGGRAVGLARRVGSSFRGRPDPTALTQPGVLEVERLQILNRSWMCCTTLAGTRSATRSCRGTAISGRTCHVSASAECRRSAPPALAGSSSAPAAPSPAPDVTRDRACDVGESLHADARDCHALVLGWKPSASRFAPSAVGRSTGSCRAASPPSCVRWATAPIWDRRPAGTTNGSLVVASCTPIVTPRQPPGKKSTSFSGMALGTRSRGWSRTVPSGAANRLPTRRKRRFARFGTVSSPPPSSSGACIHCDRASSRASGRPPSALGSVDRCTWAGGHPGGQRRGSTSRARRRPRTIASSAERLARLLRP